MSTIVAPLNENDSIASASNYFLRFRLRSAPVVDDAGLLVGMVSEKDIMAIMLGQTWWTQRIKEVMKRNVVVYEDDTPALAIYEFLCRVTLNGVVLVNQGKPTGQITRGCLLRFFINSLAARRTQGLFPEVDTAEADLIKRSRSSRPRERLGQVVRHLACEANDLDGRIEGRPDDLVPCVVGGASRLQELVNDLLALSRFANDEDDSSTGSKTDPQAPVAQGLAAAIAAMKAAEAEAAV
jgi:CBS domain-containing protein